jgi:ribosome-binding protein aMBF1 (putative translation factor)
MERIIMSIMDLVKNQEEIQNQIEIKEKYKQCIENVEILKNSNDIEKLYEILKVTLEQCVEGNLKANNFEKIRSYLNDEKPGNWKSVGGKND